VYAIALFMDCGMFGARVRFPSVVGGCADRSVLQFVFEPPSSKHCAAYISPASRRSITGAFCRVL
jgi:hypothetical protein